MVRTPRSDKNGKKKGTWTPEEDSKLIAYVTRYGCWNWRQLPKFAGLARCGKSCRLRWLNYLRPTIKRGNFTAEEDETIIKLHQKLGNKWSAIAAELPGRTDNEIKNHWHTKLKKQIELNSSMSNPQIASVSDSKDHSDPSQSTSATSEKIPFDASHLSPPTSSTCEASENVNEVVSSDYFAFLDDADFWTMADVSNFPTAPFAAEPEDIFPLYDAGLWNEIYDEFAALC